MSRNDDLKLIIDFISHRSQLVAYCVKHEKNAYTADFLRNRWSTSLDHFETLKKNPGESIARKSEVHPKKF